MHRVFVLFACLAMFLTLGVGSVTHAMEPIACADVGSDTQAVHSDGDRDQVPADSDTGYPHHHGGCHGHHIAAPAAKADVVSDRHVASLTRPALISGLPMVATEAALRPPQV